LGLSDVKRIAFVTVPLSGHLRPAVSLATEMADRGFAVDIILGAKGITDALLKLEIEKPSLTLHGVMQGDDLIQHISWSHVASSSGRLAGSKARLFEEIARACNGGIASGVERLREIIGILSRLQPDVVVVDHSQMIARQWAEDHGIPTVIMHTPYYLTGEPSGCARLDDAEQKMLADTLKIHNPMGFMTSVSAALGIGSSSKNSASTTKIVAGEKEKEEDEQEQREDAEQEAAQIPEGAAHAPPAEGLAPHTLVFCEPELLNEAHVPARVHVVGPCFAKDCRGPDEHLVPWLDEAREHHERVVYVALGTLANGFLTVDVVRTLLRAFAEFTAAGGWRVLWSLPETQQQLIDRVDLQTAHARVESFVRQRAVLSHPAVQLFLTHGGQSSVNEGLAAGVPLVCMPLFCDQYEVAEAVHRHGLGSVFHKDELLAGDAAGLASTLQYTAAEPSFKAMVARFMQLMRIREGCGRAAEVIESIAFAGADFQELWRGKSTSVSRAGCAAPGGEEAEADFDKCAQKGGA